MKFLIHGTPKGSDESDSLVIEEATIEECRAAAKTEVENRNWVDCYSEPIDG